MKTNIAESFNKDLYDKILSSFSENEKKLDSEWKIQKIYDGINYDLEKKSGNNYISLEGNNDGDYLFLGTTIFKESETEYIPNSILDVKRYIKTKESYGFKLNSESLNKYQIYEICKKGDNQTINIEFSPFLKDLDENCFKEKNLQKDLDDLNIQDLSIFYLQYFPTLAKKNQDTKYYNSEERKAFLNEIKEKIKNEENIQIKPIELYGPFGIGKSCSLLAFQKAKLFGIKSAYFNLNSLYNLQDIKKSVQMVLYESMSLFNDFTIFSNLKNEIIGKNFDNPWSIIKEVINFVLKNLNQKFIIIIDQYKEVFNNINIKSHEKLDEVLLNTDYGMIIIKCSSMNDNDVKMNFFDVVEKNKYIYIDKLFEIKSSDEKEKLYFGNISLYHYLYVESGKNFDDFIENQKKMIKSDIRKSIPESTNLLQVISFISNIMKTDSFFSEEDIKEKLHMIPLKYIILKKKIIDGKKIYTLDYSCLLIKIAFEELAYEELKKIAETPGIKNLKGTVGDLFEIMCHFALLLGGLENFNLDSKNLFYLEKNLYNNQEKEANWKENTKDGNKMKSLNSFYIRPTSTNSELYDSVIIFKEGENYSAYLLQMSISKDSGKKIANRKTHSEAITKVKSKIKKIYGIDIKNVYFSYIFNYDDIKPKDIIECITSKLDYFYFSLERNKFYQPDINTKMENKNSKIESFVEREIENCGHITKLDFNSLANMEEKNINTDFLKSQKELNIENFEFLELLKKKPKKDKISDISDILLDLEPVKKIIKRNKNLKLEICSDSGELTNVLNYLKNREYICLIGIREKIYMIYDKCTYEYNNINKEFGSISDNLGTKILINGTKVKYEIFSIIGKD